MTSETATDKEITRQVVRGERPWTDLRKLGIDIQVEGNRCLYDNPRHIHIDAAADVHDLAGGFLAYHHDPRRLREWAFVLEASDVDLDVETHPAGEILLSALWRASFGEPLGEETERLIEQLVKGN
jgi:hypothetical protein